MLTERCDGSRAWGRAIAAAMAMAMVTAGCAGIAEPPSDEAREPGVEAAQQSLGRATRPEVMQPTRTDSIASLRRLPQIPPLPAVLGTIFERPRKLLPNRVGSVGGSSADPAVQETAPGPAVPTTGTSFDGIGNLNGVLPPDPTGAIGPNHYVHMVNLSFAIFDRSGNLLLGPSNNNTLWQGFGGPCESSNDGDPVVLYDHLADRWLLSQFALPRYPRGPFYQCLAISLTGDPTGGYSRYEYTYSSSTLNDYPKFGVWPDGYYMSTNQFSCSIFGCSWAGQGVVAFERAQMLVGGTALAVKFNLFGVDANLGGMLPSDLDGPAPPAGTPNYFVQLDDDAWGYSGDQVQIWRFEVDWANPSASVFAFDRALALTAFDTNLCQYDRNCIPQPGTSVRLDAISDRLMYRLQYRSFGGYGTLVSNFTVDASGADRAGIRWFELRDSGNGWFKQQDGTFSPDSSHRWMASAAMNASGDLGVGYSVSSSSVYPSIRVSGRLDGDPPGLLTQGETTMVSGSGSQTHSASRWGDYSHLSVDPTDDCTFWYAQEYLPNAGSAPWRTRIASFRLRACAGCTPGTVCRSATGPCDVAEICATDGTCPADAHVGDGTPCDNGDLCDGTELCMGGVCQPGTPVICTSADPCLTSTCNPSSGQCEVGVQPDGTSCSDGQACNGSEACLAGDCMAGALPDCDDGDSCTADTCEEPAGCTHTFTGGPGCCSPAGSSCVDAAECCSGKCKGKPGAKTCH